MEAAIQRGSPLPNARNQSDGRGERLPERIHGLLLAIVALLKCAKMNGDGSLHLERLSRANQTAIPRARALINCNAAGDWAFGLAPAHAPFAYSISAAMSRGASSSQCPHPRPTAEAKVMRSCIGALVAATPERRARSVRQSATCVAVVGRRDPPVPPHNTYGRSFAS